jgi:hypothetical protein
MSEHPVAAQARAAEAQERLAEAIAAHADEAERIRAEAAARAEEMQVQQA